ncbi:MAG: alpha-1,2-fucosyltransferase [Polaromonas sp.]|nr:alpha-1,2-fucosyltransferase [Polaromonas sp.]
MIITQLIGGLGNQMFQYAAGRALALRHGTSLKVDTRGFEGYQLHQGFELQRVFAGAFDVASEADVRRVLGWRRSPTLRRLLGRLPTSWGSSRFAAEPHFEYWKGFEDLPADCFLSGYWQSEKYFAAIADPLRADFAFRPPLEGLNHELSVRIKGVNAISMHVRRGDYASNPQTTATHGLSPPSYYAKAISFMMDRVTNPHLFVFSDDMAWVKANLELAAPHTFVSHNRGLESYNDMRLMSHCKHHIIANSSFSWWGAWLNPDAQKVVVAPKVWFARPINAEDLYIDGWHRL